jgi:uncharacterized membrane protein HdeD (DUF308 family)
MASLMAVNNRALVPLAVLAGVALLVIGVVYFAEPAHSLPSFFPGHVGAGSKEAAHHHVKHGIAAVAVGLAAFAFAWFQSGPKGSARPPMPA